MFKRTKSLSSAISQFFEKHCTDATYLNITQEYVLSYENSIGKLDKIFKTFEDMKSALGKYREGRLFDGPHFKSLTPDDRRSSKEDLGKVRYRSKSPSPYTNYEPMPDPKKLEDLDKEFLKDEMKLNRYFKRNVTHI